MTRSLLMSHFLYLAVGVGAAPTPPEQINFSSQYGPNRNSPRLLTPQWVGEEGVDAVVILAIDDMRDHRKYELYLRPILDRLKKIDGRAPVSIMSCKIDPQTALLQDWLKEGVSIECHTADHPCPLLGAKVPNSANVFDLARAKGTYDKCVDQMFEIPHNRPVAFRVPCCDSMNTPSPRFFAEIFSKTTEKGKFLQIDSSIFTVPTANDPEAPRELVLNKDGSERFRRYVQFEGFVNVIEDYPYPYIINGTCWEFPCAVPSDWEAQNLQKPANPRTLEDWKAYLDLTVKKKGVMTTVFHPYAWSTPQQWVDLVDYADKTYGKRVKFLNFREALERLTTNVTGGKTLRETSKERADVKLPAPLPGDAPGAQKVWLVDVDEDGHDDLLFTVGEQSVLRLFDPAKGGWTREVKTEKPLPPIYRADGTHNGFFVHARALYWQNEDTAALPGLVYRASFNDVLKHVEPMAKSPAAGLASMRAAPGFKVELVAAEPAVMDPVGFSFGPDGKLWVVEMPDYPLGMDAKGTVGGRVRILEDRDGDGMYEKSTLFLDNLPYPTSVLAWRKGVLVAAAPDILYAEDTNNDQKADVRKVLFSGFSEGNQQHRINHLTYGLDGWVYGANGDSGGTIRSTQLPTQAPVSISGRDFRFKPDTGEFEAIPGQSQFGRNRTDAGDWFGCNNSNPLYHFPLDDRYMKRNPHVPPSPGVMRVNTPRVPGAAPVFPISRTQPRFNDFHTLNHFTSACSSHIYRDTLISAPEGAQTVLIAEPVHNLIHRQWLTPRGSTFISERPAHELTSEFLASTDNWSRQTTVATGPDGAVYFADMYRQVIEHPKWIPPEWQAKYNLRAGDDKGRIYRIAPVGVTLQKVPRFDTMSSERLVAALDTDNGVQRDLVQFEVLWRGDQGVVPLLTRQVLSSPHALGRLQALCTLGAMGKADAPVIKAALGDRSAAVRRHAVRIGEALFAAHPELAMEAIRLAGDPDQQVRLQLACSLGEIELPQAAEALGALATDARSDSILIAAVISSLNQRNLSAVARGVTKSARQNTPPPELLSGLLKTATALKQNDAVATIVMALTTPSNGAYQPWQLQTLANLLDAVDLKSLKAGADSGAAIAKTLEAARTIARDDSAAVEMRSAAMSLLGREASAQKQDMALLEGLLSPQSPQEIQGAVLATLTRRKEASIAPLLLRHLKGLSPKLREAVLDALLTRADWAGALLDAIEKKQLSATDLDPTRRQRLIQSGPGNTRKRAATIFADINADRQKVIDAYADAATLKGNAATGKLIFTKTCATCHKLGDTGYAVGPDLAAVGDKSAQGLLISILDPNRAVETRYLNYIASTDDDDTHTGLLSAETATSITLLGASNQSVTLLRRELKELRSSNMSLMPEGLESGLKQQDLADLIAFIRSPQ